MEINKIEWDKGQNDYVNNYQLELNNFFNNLKKPIEKLQQQISKINLECEQKFKNWRIPEKIYNNKLLKIVRLLGLILLLFFSILYLIP